MELVKYVKQLNDGRYYFSIEDTYFALSDVQIAAFIILIKELEKEKPDTWENRANQLDLGRGKCNT